MAPHVSDSSCLLSCVSSIASVRTHTKMRMLLAANNATDRAIQSRPHRNFKMTHYPPGPPPRGFSYPWNNREARTASLPERKGLPARRDDPTMPKFFIDTYDHINVVDEVGQDLPDLAAVRSLVRRSLSEIIADEADRRPAAQIRAIVRNEAGEEVLSATMHVAVEWSGAGAGS